MRKKQLDESLNSSKISSSLLDESLTSMNDSTVGMDLANISIDSDDQKQITRLTKDLLEEVELLQESIIESFLDQAYTLKFDRTETLKK